MLWAKHENNFLYFHCIYMLTFSSAKRWFFCQRPSVRATPNLKYQLNLCLGIESTLCLWNLVSSIEAMEMCFAVTFTPTVPHCSLASLIGLCIREKLKRTLPYRTKINIFVKKGSHASEDDGKLIHGLLNFMPLKPWPYLLYPIYWLIGR